MMFRHHPPLMLPPSSPVSSITKSFQTPLAFVPLNTLSAEPPEGAGAGGLKPSTPSKFVGLNVPETRGPLSGKLVAAASASVKVTLVAAVPPPTSDKMIAFWPPGPTSSMSTSSGKVWLRLFSVTDTLATVPITPEIEMLEGYGDAIPLGLMVMDVGLQPLGQVPFTVTSKLQLSPTEGVQVTVVVPIGKKDPDAGEQVTVPHAPLVVGAG